MYYFLMRLFYEFNENIFQKARHKKNWLISSLNDSENKLKIHLRI